MPLFPSTSQKNHPLLHSFILSISLGFLLLSGLQQVGAKIVHVGKGSGALNLDSMNGLEEGDTVVIKHGTYSGGTISNLIGITIMPETPGVAFNGTFHIGKNKKVTIDGTTLAAAEDDNSALLDDKKAKGDKKPEIVYGYTFSGLNHEHAFVPTGNNTDLTIKGIWFKDISAMDGSGDLMTYDGKPETTLFYNLTLDTVKFTGHADIYDGTWAPPKSYKNVNIGMVLKNVIFINDGTQENTKFFGNSIYKMTADHWIIIGPTINLHDVGILVVMGNGTFKNIYRNGGWGYVLRIWNISLGETADSYFYNVIDVNSTRYGTLDSRVDSSLLNEKGPIPVLGGNMHVFNVTSGNKYDVTNEYISPLLVVGAMTGNDGHVYTTEMRNCFCFHPIGHILQNNSGTPPVAVDVSNNIEIPGSRSNAGYKGGALPDGYVSDMIKFCPSSGSKLIGAGMAIPQVTTDIYGNPRTDSNDIGAVQYTDSTATDKIDAFFGKTLKLLEENPTMHSEAGDINPIPPAPSK